MLLITIFFLKPLVLLLFFCFIFISIPRKIQQSTIFFFLNTVNIIYGFFLLSFQLFFFPLSWYFHKGLTETKLFTHLIFFYFFLTSFFFFIYKKILTFSLFFFLIFLSYHLIFNTISHDTTKFCSYTNFFFLSIFH